MAVASSSSRQSLIRARTLEGPERKVCAFGTKCYRRNPEHLRDEVHPADDDYMYFCRRAGCQPTFVSIRKLFEWCDSSCSGKITMDELEVVWDEIKRLGHDVPELTEGLWNKMDEDGNGHINFSEFAEFTTMVKVNLPLGLDDLIHSNAEAALRCGVFDCPCRLFHTRRPRCRYGEGCYQANPTHRDQFCHPTDDDWNASVCTSQDENMCFCGHKKKLHASAAMGAGSVQYPAHWTEVTGDQEFLHLVPVPTDTFQKLLHATYSDVTTRDRARHSGGWMVPRDFTMVRAFRNENSKLFRKYVIRKAELQEEKRLVDGHPAEARDDLEFRIHDDMQTTQVWEAFDADKLDRNINEWYLFHGTSAAAAKNICQSDFKMRLAGSSTGTLYGRGTYLAESITKADEYAKDENGTCTVLLCRVLGGRVLYTDERTPDAAALTAQCVEGPYDCILGDRVKVSGTYREIIVFDTENLYPEYILEYKRGELFKSPSHP